MPFAEQAKPVNGQILLMNGSADHMNADTVRTG
jgi:hypothetical protein